MNDFWTAFAAIVSVFTIIGGAYSLGWAHGYKAARTTLCKERDLQRFTELYAPFMGFFTDCHIATGVSVLAPTARHRISNAIDLLKKSKPLPALRACFDKRETQIMGEVEYGRPFPLPEITEHLQGREHFADQKLITLLSQANRARHERDPHQPNLYQDDSLLTTEDLNLFDHIYLQHKRLASRFAGR